MKKILLNLTCWFWLVAIVLGVYFAYTRFSVLYFQNTGANQNHIAESQLVTLSVHCANDIKNTKIQANITAQKTTFTNCDAVLNGDTSELSEDLQVKFEILKRRIEQYYSLWSTIGASSKIDLVKSSESVDELRKTAALISKTQTDLFNYHHQKTVESFTNPINFIGLSLAGGVGNLIYLIWLLSYMLQNNTFLRKILKNYSYDVFPGVKGQSVEMISILNDSFLLLISNFSYLQLATILGYVSTIFLVLTVNSRDFLLFAPNAYSLVVVLFSISSPYVLLGVNTLLQGKDISLTRVLIATFLNFHNQMMLGFKIIFRLLPLLFHDLPNLIKNAFYIQYSSHFLFLTQEVKPENLMGMSIDLVQKNTRVILKVAILKYFLFVILLSCIGFITMQLLPLQNQILGYFVAFFILNLLFVFDATVFSKLVAGHNIKDYDTNATLEVKVSRVQKIRNFIITLVFWLSIIIQFLPLPYANKLFSMYLLGMTVTTTFLFCFAIMAIIFVIKKVIKKPTQLLKKALISLTLACAVGGVTLANIVVREKMDITRYLPGKVCINMDCDEYNFDLQYKFEENTARQKLSQLEAEFKITDNVLKIYPKAEILTLIRSKVETKIKTSHELNPEENSLNYTYQFRDSLYEIEESMYPLIVNQNSDILSNYQNALNSIGEAKVASLVGELKQNNTDTSKSIILAQIKEDLVGKEFDSILFTYVLEHKKAFGITE